MLPLSIVVVVTAIALESASARFLTYLALIAVPPLAAAALASGGTVYADDHATPHPPYPSKPVHPAHAPQPAHWPAHFECRVPHSLQTCSTLVRAMRRA